MAQLILTAIAGLLASLVTADAFSWSSAEEQRVLELVRQFQITHKVPSIAISVTVDGKAVLAEGIGADELIVPGGEKIRYPIGSVTKQFTAAAILALIEDGTIVPFTKSPVTLDTPLSDICPDDVDPQSEVGKITVRRLLTMTSNLPSYTADPAMLSADQTGTAPASSALDVGQIIDRLKSYRPVGMPLAFEYSNTNYFALAVIIHFLSGGGHQPTAVLEHNYIQQRILAKAAMTRSGFVSESAPQEAINAAPNFLHSRWFDQGAWPNGAGDLVSTTADMAHWNIALMSGNVINKASLQTMLTPAAAVTNSEPYRECQYAMGWYVCDKPGYRLHQHDGVISGFMASNAIARQQNGSWMSATVLANIDATIDIVELVRSIVEVGR